MTPITTKEAARLLGISEQRVRIGVRTTDRNGKQVLPIGFAAGSKKHLTYTIWREKVYEFMGIRTFTADPQAD